MTVRAKRINVPTKDDRSSVRTRAAAVKAVPAGVSIAFTADDLAGTFDTRALERGRHLAGLSPITVDESTGQDRFSAAVTDGRHHYRVQVVVGSSPAGVVFNSQCSCRTAHCAHAAAACFALMERRAQQLEAARASQTPAAPALPEPQTVAYGIDVAEEEGALYVTVFLESRQGGQLKQRVSSPKRALPLVAEDASGERDRQILELLGRSSLPLVALPLEQDEQIDHLLTLLGETKRCRWLPSKVVISRGPEKRFLVECHARTGAWRVLNPAPRVRLIRCEEPWYVNEATGKIGPAEVEMVSAESFTPSADLPKQNQPGHEAPVIVNGIAVPVLVPAGTGGKGGAENFDALLLQFDYGESRVREDEPGQFVRLEGEAGPIFIRRDRRVEEQAANTLRAMGLSAVRITTERKGGSDAACRGYAFRTRSALDSWAEFMLKDVDVLRKRGWRVELGQQFQYRVIDISDDWHVEVFDIGNEWFSLDVGIEIEGRRYPLLPILIGMIERGGMAALRTEDGKVRAMLDDGRILSLPAERVAKFLATLQEMMAGGRLGRDGRLSLSTAEAPALVELEEIVGTRWYGGTRLREVGRRLRAFDNLERVTPPEIFKAELRPYQCEGLDWLQFLRRSDMAGILADDMGLGKTAQTLAHLAVEAHEGRLDRPALIVVPTSLVPNWTAEAGRFVPSLSVLVFHGLDRHQRRREVADSNIVVTTYAIVARDIDFLSGIEWHLIVLDEAQAIKNPAAKATRAVCKLKARHRLCLSGTPIENHLGEVWSQFAFLMPGILGDQRSFTARFRTPIEKHGDTERRTLLARRLRPFMLRRTKAEVATDLPAKTEIVRRVELATDQRDLYETIRLSMHQRVREEIARLGIARSRIVILDALLKLRQVCCDPRLVKLKTAQKATGSGKLETLMEMLPEMIEEGRHILLFSQFTSMLDLIKESLAPLGLPYLELRGDTADRATPVQRFQAGEIPLFLISLKAGGKGLNLTAADTVIHYDPWWNPAIEHQATDRAHRIGQDKPVFVYKMIAAGTVEERIVELQEKKGALADAMLDEGTWIGQIDNDDLDYLFEGTP